MDVALSPDFESVPDLAFVPPELDPERSFFAQPEPLNTTVGRVNAFRRLPSAPHAGQNRGPAASIPWMTSVDWPQLLQT